MSFNHHRHPRPVGDLAPLEMFYQNVVLFREKFQRGNTLDMSRKTPYSARHTWGRAFAQG
ncbi:hypothetical protein EMPG_14022 [Blastomyces silverae]|uniref:Uncharacterized protein n=1 Tax=Blastomyces silverae TaxID=2060906 RepID=A0A0H1BHQ5_9EURO|nr:hypothetical protein EMPG_14022 [Blastomyces silverae]